MDPTQLMMGFGLLLLGLALGRLDRWRYGWFTLSVLATLVGALTLGYLLGREDAAQDAVRLVNRLPQPASITEVGDLQRAVIALWRLDVWPLFVAALFLCGGAAGCLAFLPVRQVVESVVPPEQPEGAHGPSEEQQGV